MTIAGSPPITASAAALLDVKAVAELLHCSPRHVYRLSDAGQMPSPIRLGALVRWRRTTGNPTTGLEDWIAAGCPTIKKGASQQ
jgi:predicted DNA-binding transcriptional regulator AlpA